MESECDSDKENMDRKDVESVGDEDMSENGGNVMMPHPASVSPWVHHQRFQIHSASPRIHSLSPCDVIGIIKCSNNLGSDHGTTTFNTYHLYYPKSSMLLFIHISLYCVSLGLYSKWPFWLWQLCQNFYQLAFNFHLMVSLLKTFKLSLRDRPSEPATSLGSSRPHESQVGSGVSSLPYPLITSMPACWRTRYESILLLKWNQVRCILTWNWTFQQGIVSDHCTMAE